MTRRANCQALRIQGALDYRRAISAQGPGTWCDAREVSPKYNPECLAGRCRLTPHWVLLDRACFQRVKLKHDELCCQFPILLPISNLRRYSPSLFDTQSCRVQSKPGLTPRLPEAGDILRKTTRLMWYILILLRASVCAGTLQVSHALISVECLLSMPLL
jgi:hypothetical protein